MIILISGKMASGKDEAGKFLKSYFEETTEIHKKTKVRIDKIARPLKEGVAEMFGISLELLEDRTYKNLRVGIDLKPTTATTEKDFTTIFYMEKYYGKTIRQILQEYGSEMKEKFGEDYWVKSFLRSLTNRDNKFLNNEINIITDLRFPIELESVHKYVFDFQLDNPMIKNGSLVTIRIEDNRIDRSGDEHKHESETALDERKIWDYKIYNNSNLEEFHVTLHKVAKDIIKNKI